AGVVGEQVVRHRSGATLNVDAIPGAVADGVAPDFVVGNRQVGHPVVGRDALAAVKADEVVADGRGRGAGREAQAIARAPHVGAEVAEAGGRGADNVVGE
nr:hypothetical protein [Tanacetum cinerariifolium]